MAHPTNDHRRHPRARRPIPVRMVGPEPTALGGSKYRLFSSRRGPHNSLSVRTGVRDGRIRPSLCGVRSRCGSVHAHHGRVRLPSLCATDVRGYGSGMGQYFFGAHDGADRDRIACRVVVLRGEAEEVEHQGLVMECRYFADF